MRRRYFYIFMIVWCIMAAAGPTVITARAQAISDSGYLQHTNREMRAEPERSVMANVIYMTFAAAALVMLAVVFMRRKEKNADE